MTYLLDVLRVEGELFGADAGDLRNRICAFLGRKEGLRLLALADTSAKGGFQSEHQTWVLR